MVHKFGFRVTETSELRANNLYDQKTKQKFAE